MLSPTAGWRSLTKRQVFLRSSFSIKLNLVVELRKKHAALVIKRWVAFIRRRTLVRCILQVSFFKMVNMCSYSDLMYFFFLMFFLVKRQRLQDLAINIILGSSCEKTNMTRDGFAISERTTVCGL